MEHPAGYRPGNTAMPQELIVFGHQDNLLAGIRYKQEAGFKVIQEKTADLRTPMMGLKSRFKSKRRRRVLSNDLKLTQGMHDKTFPYDDGHHSLLSSLFTPPCLDLTTSGSDVAASWLVWTLRFLKNSVGDYNVHP